MISAVSQVIIFDLASGVGNINYLNSTMLCPQAKRKKNKLLFLLFKCHVVRFFLSALEEMMFYSKVKRVINMYEKVIEGGKKNR